MPDLLSPLPRLKTWDDPRLQRLSALGRRDQRDRTGLFFAEGLRFVGQAVAQNAALEAVLTVPKTLDHPFGRKLRQQLARQGVPVWETTPELFLRLSRANEPQWIGALLRQRWDTLAAVTASPGLCWTALDQVHSPGNLGTILRTSEAVGASGLILLGDSVDPYDPACVRATMGALFAQRLVRAAPAEFAAWKQRTGRRLIGTSPHAAQDYRSIAYPLGTLLFLGGEKKGLSEERQGLCDEMVRIPMAGQGDSLNLAVAAGILLYEIFSRQHQATSKGDGQTCHLALIKP